MWTDSLLSRQAGKQGCRSFTGSLTVSLQPMFVRRGTGSREDEVRLRVDYLDVPLLLRLNATEQFFVEAGGYAGFRLDSRTFADSEYVENSSEGLDQVHRDIDAGSVLGIGYKFGGRTSLSLRYSYSPVNLYEEAIYTDPNGEPLDVQPSILQQSIQLLFAYNIFQK